ncbi:FmdB family zinc ribbon protein [Polaromonas sp.]|uniref:FmdB family zinc ribbon protein n=1 Tax=Polaromonas sp. TaxID=1869339 RepID=UPI002FCAB064
MPIYAYKCESCGHTKDVLQKISDAPLSDCPQCGAPSFKKQVTAAGFQLKGSGWYVTDFRGGASSSSTPSPAGDSAAKATESKTAESAAGIAVDSAKPSSTAAAAAPAPSASAGAADKAA